MDDTSPIDNSIKALIREAPSAIVRLAGVHPPPDRLIFDDTAINLAERRADHVLVLGAPEDPNRGALYLEYQLRPKPSLIPEWEFKRSALRLRLEMPVVLLVLYLEKGDRITFPSERREEVRGVVNEYRFSSVRLWEHADRIRSGELWELAPLLVLCEDNPDEETFRTEVELITGSGADVAIQADLLAMALRIGARDLPRATLEAIFKELLPMVEGASIIDDWIAEGEARGEARGRDADAREMLLSLLHARIGEPPAALLVRIENADAAWCKALLLQAARAESFDELGW